VGALEERSRAPFFKSYQHEKVFDIVEIFKEIYLYYNIQGGGDMITRLQKIRLGIFFSVSIVALIVIIVLIVTPKFLKSRDLYYIAYKNISVTGLQIGGVVKYHGLTVGNVSNISIDTVDIQRVIVEVSLEPGTPIKEDTYADIQMVGITGLKLIELRGGTNEAKSLKPGSFIKAGGSVTELITGKAGIIAEKAEMILNNLSALTSVENRDKFIRLMESSSATVEELNKMLRENRRGVKETIDNSRQIASEFQSFLISADEALKSFHRLMDSDSLKVAVNNLAVITESLKRARFVELVKELNSSVEHINTILKDVDIALMKNREDLGYSLGTLKESIEYLNQFSRLISEDPSILVRGAQPRNVPDFKLEK